jgi:hypothetical protein
MAPRPTLANSVKLEANWTGPSGRTATNIMYALFSADVSEVSQLTTIATNFKNALTVASTGILAQLSDAYELASVRAIDNSGETENAVTGVVGTAGGVSQAALSPNVAATISWTIAAHYRGGHPRMYLPGAPVNAVTAAGSGTWTSTFRDALSAAGSAFLTSFNEALVGSITEQIGTISFFRNKVARVPPVFYPYEEASVYSRLDSQRRRLGKENTAL